MNITFNIIFLKTHILHKNVKGERERKRGRGKEKETRNKLKS